MRRRPSRRTALILPMLIGFTLCCRELLAFVPGRSRFPARAFGPALPLRSPRIPLCSARLECPSEADAATLLIVASRQNYAICVPAIKAFAKDPPEAHFHIMADISEAPAFLAAAASKIALVAFEALRDFMPARMSRSTTLEVYHRSTEAGARNWPTELWTSPPAGVLVAARAKGSQTWHVLTRDGGSTANPWEKILEEAKVAISEVSSPQQEVPPSSPSASPSASQREALPAVPPESGAAGTIRFAPAKHWGRGVAGTTDGRGAKYVAHEGFRATPVSSNERTPSKSVWFGIFKR